MENGWTSCVKNEVLPRVQEERNIPRAVKQKLSGLVTSVGTALQTHVMEENIEGMG